MRQTIDELVDIQIGYQFRERLTMESDGTHQVIQAKDIDEQHGHRLIASSLCRVTPKRDAEKYEVTNGDVIFLSKGRRNYATLIEGLHGGTSVARPDDGQEAGHLPTIAAGYFFILRPRTQRIRTDYLAWAINAPAAQAYLRSVAGGSGMPFVSKHAFLGMEIDVPPPERQRLIVELHRLAERQSHLLRELERKQSELTTGICVAAARRNER